MSRVPVMLERDARCWRVLAAGGYEAVREPWRVLTAVGFAMAAKAANSAVCPDQTPATVQACRKLIELAHGRRDVARAWRALPADKRARLNLELWTVAEAVGRLVGAPPPGPAPEPPPNPAAAQRLPYPDDTLEEDAA